MLTKQKNVRSPITREVLKEIQQYEGLPFAKRWLTRKFGPKTNFALRELVQQGIVEKFPPLVEVKKGLVAQAEHTVLVDDGAIILTK